MVQHLKKTISNYVDGVTLVGPFYTTCFIDGFSGFHIFASFIITYLGCKNDAKTQKPQAIDAKNENMHSV